MTSALMRSGLSCFVGLCALAMITSSPLDNQMSSEDLQAELDKIHSEVSTDL